MPRLVVGLGNPGSEYQGTRHNVGFEVLDRLAREVGVLFQTASKLDGYTGPKAFEFAQSAKYDALFLKPLSYMNRSGEIVLPVARLLGRGEPLDPSHILVVYDDLDLDVGRLRIRPHGGAGGHNGMRSIIANLDSDRFPRLRVGIGSAGTDAARYVLSPFAEKERVEIDISVAEATDAILDWLTHGDIEGAMTRFHSRWNQES